ncbi:hypothetical protein CLAIMM_11277 [Cladophialophora immunda]|nr:hypothetical protein CLAIMM_11277 [Cladophialophora immunda]
MQQDRRVCRQWPSPRHQSSPDCFFGRCHHHLCLWPILPTSGIPRFQGDVPRAIHGGLRVGSCGSATQVAVPLAELSSRLACSSNDFDVKLRAILSGTAKENPDHSTIPYELVRSDLPPQEKQIDCPNEEAQLLAAAGLTISLWVMSVAAFYITRTRWIYEELRAELITALPRKSDAGTFNWGDVEKLPYLTACACECLRLSYGVTSRSPRLWDRPLPYRGRTIPRGRPSA